MANRIAHASHDENGKYKGGKAGDQTGSEVYIRTWYNRPWNYVIRCKDANMREKIAYAMERACANNKIGYDQNQRNTLLSYARKVGYDPGKVTTACETDCSALVTLACIYAGVKESALYIGGNSATTTTIRSRLMNTGKFETLTASKYLSSSEYLLRGDILLYEGHHVAVAIDNGSKSGYKQSSTSQSNSTTGYELVFDANFYAKTYPDLKSAFGTDAKALLNHFKTYGMKEGRQAISTFNVHIYKNRYTDLQKAFGNDLSAYYNHYIQYGHKEGRSAV